MKDLLKGKVAVVLEGGTTLGEIVSNSLAGSGASVTLNGRPVDPLPAIVQEITFQGGAAAFYPVEVRTAEAAEKLCQKVCADYGKLDVVVLLTQRLGLDAGLELIPAFMTQLRSSRGCIVIGDCRGGSTADLRAAVARLAIAAAEEGVRVNGISVASVSDSQTHSQNGCSHSSAETPLGREASPAEIGHGFCFFSSEAAGYITGQVLAIDGGAEASRAVARLDKYPETKAG